MWAEQVELVSKVLEEAVTTDLQPVDQGHLVYAGSTATRGRSTCKEAAIQRESTGAYDADAHLHTENIWRFPSAG